jgi:hypothetical protein
MSKVLTIINELEGKASELRKAGLKEAKKAEKLLQKAQDVYKKPDEFMELVQKVVSYAHLVVMKYNAIATRQAQEITRKAGARHELAERANRVATKFEALTK